MRRAPYKGAKLPDNVQALNAPISYDPKEWANSEEAAILLRKFRRKDGKPSVGAIHTMIYRRQIAAHRFFGRLLFRRSELMQLVSLSPITGG